MYLRLGALRLFVTMRYINSAYDSLSYLHTQKHRFGVALDVKAKKLEAKNKARSTYV
jgi:hypothetical protein